jgi:hypothetical protein
MTVHHLYKNKPFDPEAIMMMTRAYADVCHKLGLNQSDRPEVNAVAKKVIEFAQRGDRDRVRLSDHVLQALKDSSPRNGHAFVALILHREGGPQVVDEQFSRIPATCRPLPGNRAPGARSADTSANAANGADLPPTG